MLAASTPCAVSDDASLVQRIRDGEAQLFYDLIRPHERSLYVLAYSIVRNPADAAEVAQEALVKAFTHLVELHSAARFKPWLFQIAINEARLRRRKYRRRLYDSIDDPEGPVGEEHLAHPGLCSQFASPIDLLQQQELRRVMEQAVLALPRKYREVCILRDVEDLSTEETAEVLSISVSAAKTRLHRARRQLRQQLMPLLSSARPTRRGSFAQRDSGVLHASPV